MLRAGGATPLSSKFPDAMKGTPSTPAKAPGALEGLATAEHTPSIDDARDCSSGRNPGSGTQRKPLPCQDGGVMVRYDTDAERTASGCDGWGLDRWRNRSVDGQDTAAAAGFGSGIFKLLTLRAPRAVPDAAEAPTGERFKRRCATCWGAAYSLTGNRSRRSGYRHNDAVHKLVAILTVCCCTFACVLAGHALIIQQPAHALLHLVLALVFVYLLVLENHGANLPTRAATVVAASLQAGLCIVGAVLWLGDFAGLLLQMRQHDGSQTGIRPVQFWSCTPPSAALVDGHLGSTCTAKYIILAAGYGSSLLCSCALAVTAAISAWRFASVLYRSSKCTLSPASLFAASRNTQNGAGTSNQGSHGHALWPSSSLETVAAGGSGLERLCLDMTEQIRAAAAAAAASAAPNPTAPADQLTTDSTTAQRSP